MRRTLVCASTALLIPLILTSAGCSGSEEVPEFVPRDRSADEDAGADDDERDDHSPDRAQPADDDTTSGDDDSEPGADDDGDRPDDATPSNDDTTPDDGTTPDDVTPGDDDTTPDDDRTDDDGASSDDDASGSDDDGGTSGTPEPEGEGAGGADSLDPSSGGMSLAGEGGCPSCSGAPSEPEPPEPTMIPGDGGTECGSDVCATDEVCCNAGPCSGMCVIDCRPMQWCPSDLVCNVDTGVCDPPEGPGPAPSGSGTGPAPSGSGTGPAPSGSSTGPAPSGSGTGPAPSGSGTGPAPSGTGSGGPPSGPPDVQGETPDCSTVGQLPSINTPGPNVPEQDSLQANFNVDLNDCIVRREVLECNANVNEQHLYEETLLADARELRSNAIPNHEVGEFPNPGQNPHEILPQNLIYQVPLVASGEGEPLQVVFGVATSGVVFEPQTAEYFNDGEWLYEALRFDTASNYDAADSSEHPGALGLDCNFAHVQSSGKYHYHGVPTTLLPEEPALTFVGWAGDGYPIFGVWGPTANDDAGSEVRVMLPSYRIIGEGNEQRPEGAPPGVYDGTFVQDWEFVPGLGDLDECNGRTAEVVVDGEVLTTYHYVITHAFPYIPRCFKAQPDASFDPRTPP